MHQKESPLLAAARGAAVWAGPAAVLSLLLLFAGLAVMGDDVNALSRSVLGVASSAVALVSLGLLLLGLGHLAGRSSSLQDGRGRTAVLVAFAGTLLVVGGAWSQLVVLPALASDAPRLAQEGLPLVTAGFVVSFLVAGLGWLLVALRLRLRLRREAVVRRLHGNLLLAGALLMVPPLPSRWFLLAVAVTLIARDRKPVAAAQPVPVG